MSAATTAVLIAAGPGPTLKAPDGNKEAHIYTGEMFNGERVQRFVPAR